MSTVAPGGQRNSSEEPNGDPEAAPPGADGGHPSPDLPPGAPPTEIAEPLPPRPPQAFSPPYIPSTLGLDHPGQLLLFEGGPPLRTDPTEPLAPERVDTEPCLLPSGVPVFFLARHPGSAIEVQVLVRAGSVDDPQDKDGLAHVLEHMLLRTSAGASGPIETERRRRDNGQSNNASTACTWTRFEFKVPPHRSDALRNELLPIFEFPEIAPDSLALEKGAIHAERLISNPSPVTSAYFRQGLPFAANSEFLAPSIIGTRESCEGITVDDLRLYHQAHYTAGKIAMFVSAPDFQAVWRVLKSLPVKGTTTPGSFVGGSSNRNWTEDPQQRLQVLEVPDAEFNGAQVVAGFPGITPHDQDYPALVVLRELFATSLQSRLLQSLRIQRGLVYDTRMFRYDGLPGVAAEIVQFTVNDSKLTQSSLDAFVAEARLLSGGVDKSELDAGRRAASRRFAWPSLPWWIETYASSGRVIDERPLFLAIREVTAADITRVAERIFDFSKMRVHVTLSDASATPAIQLP